MQPHASRGRSPRRSAAAAPLPGARAGLPSEAGAGSSCRSRPGRRPTSPRASSATRLAEIWGQGVVIENQMGAGGEHRRGDRREGGAGRLHAADGRASTTSSTRACTRTSRTTSQRDFKPIARVAVAPLAIIANPSLPPNTIPELVALAKANPKTVHYGSGGNGSVTHLVLRAAQGEGRHRHDARALQGHRADDDRHPRQPDPARLARGGERGAAGEGREAEGARGHEREALVGAPRRADRRRSGVSRTTTYPRGTACSRRRARRTRSSRRSTPTWRRSRRAEGVHRAAAERRRWRSSCMGPAEFRAFISPPSSTSGRSS